jgi:hypothetical protein
MTPMYAHLVIRAGNFRMDISPQMPVKIQTES